MMRWFALLLCSALTLAAAQVRLGTPPLEPAESVKEGRELVAKLLAQQPAEEMTNFGWLEIRHSHSPEITIPVKFRVEVEPTRWVSVYETLPTNGATAAVKLTVVHSGEAPNQYTLVTAGKKKELTGNETMSPFAGSDFWVADLGLEFFHWPEQKVLKHQMRRGRPCKVLESINPTPATNGYARVVSWIDNETGGIVMAEAYDVHDDLLKEFEPKSFKKINGQWELREMQIINDQTDSRTRIEFKLNSDQD
ncbi:MAG TPA: outer membrane lipoprotein-sorting protein [Verrucomicrobiae bacterium]|nr:outer membrane lipoprotein-sorting protein [Verrucomicrobiae bacterium]